jgi:hypothetical protein
MHCLGSCMHGRCLCLEGSDLARTGEPAYCHYFYFLLPRPSCLMPCVLRVDVVDTVDQPCVCCCAMQRMTGW